MEVAWIPGRVQLGWRTARERIRSGISTRATCPVNGSKLRKGALQSSAKVRLAAGSSVPLPGDCRSRHRCRSEAADSVQPGFFLLFVTWFRMAPRWSSASEPLDDRHVGLAAALAHGLQPIAATGPLELVEQGGHDPGAGGADRVAE